MVSSDKKLANAMGGKTARACDSCIRKRARWYCAADDVFLCQSCDALVHTAYPLARGHERVRLKIASLKLSSLEIPAPPWHQGFTKKSRTPRGNNSNKHASRRTPKSKESSMSFNPLHLVPEIGSDEVNSMNSDEQLLYQVPVFDPFAGELCFSGDFSEMSVRIEQAETTTPTVAKHDESKVPFNLNSLNGLILPSDLELAEFSANVESLLGKGLDEESFDIEGLGLQDCRLKDSERVKVEEEIQCEVGESEIEMMREPFQLSFDYDSPTTWEEEDEKAAVEDGGGGGGNQMSMVKNKDEKCEPVSDEHVNIQTQNYDNIRHTSKKNKKMLKLDYKGIISAWDDQRSPWTTRDRPKLDPNDFWLDCMGGCGKMQHHHFGDMGMMTGNLAMLDGARVY